MAKTISEERIKLIKNFYKRGKIYPHMGISVEKLEHGSAILSMEFKEELSQPYGTAHGGALAALADSAIAFSILTIVGEEKKIITVELKINYLLPFCSGKAFGEAKILRMGKRIVVGEVEIYDEKRNMLAKAISTNILVEK